MIDEDAIISEMLDTWVNGNRKEVRETLERDHPGLAAFFITEGIKTKKLTLADVNTLVNSLMEDRRILLNTGT